MKLVLVFAALGVLGLVAPVAGELSAAARDFFCEELGKCNRAAVMALIKDCEADHTQEKCRKVADAAREGKIPDTGPPQSPGAGNDEETVTDQFDSEELTKEEIGAMMKQLAELLVEKQSESANPEKLLMQILMNTKQVLMNTEHIKDKLSKLFEEDVEVGPENPGKQKPGKENPLPKIPAEKPSQENPETGNTAQENPETGNTAQENPETGNTAQENPGPGDQGTGSEGTGKQGTGQPGGGQGEDERGEDERELKEELLDLLHERKRQQLKDDLRSLLEVILPCV